MSDPIRQYPSETHEGEARDTLASRAISSALAARSDCEPDTAPQKDADTRADTDTATSIVTEATLLRLIEGGVIPRLMLAAKRAGPQASAPAARRAPIRAAMVAKAADLAMYADGVGLERLLTARLTAGATPAHLMQHLLAPAARLLGRYWEEDRCSFTDVTVGLGTLQRALRFLSGLACESAPDHERTALLSTMPGAAHSFGLLMVETDFRAAGWRTVCAIGDPADMISRRLRTQWFDLFALSVSCIADLDRAAAIIKDIRNASRNRAIKVLTGGLVYLERPDLRMALGEDMNATNGSEAVAMANAGLGMREGRI